MKHHYADSRTTLFPGVAKKIWRRIDRSEIHPDSNSNEGVSYCILQSFDHGCANMRRIPAYSRVVAFWNFTIN